MTVPFLSAADVGERLDVSGAADVLEAALAGGLDPEADPPRQALEVGRGELLVMPSAAGGHAAVKLVSVGVIRGSRASAWCSTARPWLRPPCWTEGP
jgi:hypothetical protein